MAISGSHLTSGIYGFSVWGVDVTSDALMAYRARLAVAEKILFLSTKQSDKATLTASSQVATLPVQAVQDQDPTNVWRSMTNVTEYIDITFPSAIAVDAGACTFWQGALSSSAQFRLTGYATALDRTNNDPSVDTDWQSVWPTGGDGPYVHASEDWGPEVALIRVDNEESYRYWRFWFTDADSQQGYLDIGRIAVGKASQFRINPRVDGSLGFIALDVQEPNGFGQIFTDARPYQQRQATYVWSSLGQQDVQEDAMELARLRGQAGDFYVFQKPTAIEDFHLRSMQGIFENAHKFVPVSTYVTDKDGQVRSGYAFTLTIDQKL